MKKYLLISSLFLFLAASCSSDSDDDEMMLPVQKDVTYTNTIKTIIDGNCLDCHRNPPRNGASISLTNLEEVRDAVQNRDLIGRVESGSMPPVGDFLTASEVQALKDWQTGDFQE
jgi:mono/diheme cytochrome c family protein